MIERTFKIECANCRLECDLPENISLMRLNDEAQEFFKKHKTRIGNRWCSKENLFVRTYAHENTEEKK